jgi:hypothetical protein
VSVIQNSRRTVLTCSFVWNYCESSQTFCFLPCRSVPPSAPKPEIFQQIRHWASPVPRTCFKKIHLSVILCSPRSLKIYRHKNYVHICLIRATRSSHHESGQGALFSQDCVWLQSTTGRSFAGIKADRAGRWIRIALVQNAVAFTGACALMARRTGTRASLHFNIIT